MTYAKIIDGLKEHMKKDTTAFKNIRSFWIKVFTFSTDYADIYKKPRLNTICGYDWATNQCLIQQLCWPLYNIEWKCKQTKNTGGEN